MIEELLTNNEFFKGGFVLMVMGGLMAYFRNLPVQAYHLAKRKLIYHYTIESNDEAFSWMIHWFQNNLPEKKLKKAIIMTNLNVKHDGILKVINNDEDVISKKEKINIYFKPNTIVFLFKYKNTYIICHVNREKMENKDGGFIVNFYETISLYYYNKTKGKLLVQELIQEAYNDYRKREDKNLIKIKMAQYDRWGFFGTWNKRSKNSIIFDNGIVDNLISDIQNFITGKQWYIDMGIPYKRGYLLYGPPGNGKTSLTHVIASKFNLNINFLNLGNPDMSDTYLVNLMSNMNHNDLLVLEDIDTIFVNNNSRELKSTKANLTFSGLLNALDGFLSGKQFLTFMTTNHKDKLDPAFVRPGRIDYQLHIPNASHDQIIQMFNKFYPSLNGNFEQILRDKIPEGSVCMSKIQEHLLQYKDKDAVQNIKQLLNI